MIETSRFWMMLVDPLPAAPMITRANGSTREAGSFLGGDALQKEGFMCVYKDLDYKRRSGAGRACRRCWLISRCVDFKVYSSYTVTVDHLQHD